MAQDERLPCRPADFAALADRHASGRRYAGRIYTSGVPAAAAAAGSKQVVFAQLLRQPDRSKWNFRCRCAGRAKAVRLPPPMDPAGRKRKGVGFGEGNANL
jgi:hypothetical protein